MMDLDELRSVQSRERQTDSLQQLRESFYRDAGEFIQQLHRERERAADQADDPWDAPEVNRLSDDIDTAEQTVEAIYERRVGKVVKMASLAAADMPTEDEGLTAEERTLFETLVDAIERNRANVEAVIDGENPAQAVADAGADAGSGPPEDPSADAGGDPDRTDVPSDPAAIRDEESRPDPPPDAPGVDAADLMGEGPDDGPGETAESDDAGTDGSDRSPGEGVDGPPQADGGHSTDEREGADTAAVDRATVRITSEVGEIFGVDQRAYDLSADDVVKLPEANAGPLVDRGAAERLD